ncbi:MAG: serine hydrolase [Planctomycetota bacterium]
MLSLAILALLIPQSNSADAQNVQALSVEVVRAATELGIRLPAAVPQNWQSLAAPSALPPSASLMAPWPTNDWSTSTPRAQGMDPAGIRTAFQYGAAHGSNAMLVIRNGYIVAEWYSSTWNQNEKEDGFSMAKSVSSALYGAALADGIFPDIDTKASDYIQEWNSPWNQEVSLRNLLNMNSGLHWDFITDYLLLGLAFDQSQFAIDLSMDHFPGATWVYNNSACQVLSAVFERRTGVQLERYARQRLFSVIGMHNATWMKDFSGNTLTYRSVFASAREFAKFGYLYLRGGEWDGQQVIPQQWVHQSARPSQTENPFYGYLWWLNTGAMAMQDVPADAFYAAGAFVKRIYVVPSQDLIVIRLGPDDLNWDDNAYLGPISQAVQ